MITSNKAKANLAAAQSANAPVSEEHIPDHLKSLKQWLVWRYAHRNGTAAKLPSRVDGSSQGWNTQAHWSSFDEAIELQHAEVELYRGLALVLSEDDEVVCLDFDDCVRHDQVLPVADEIIGRFPGAYVEWSPSKTGFKLFIKAKLPGGASRAEIEVGEGDDSFTIELFSHNKWLAITGEPYGSGSEVVEGQDALDKLLAEYKPKVTQSSSSQLVAPDDVESWIDSGKASLRAVEAFQWLRDEAEESANGAGGNAAMYRVVSELWSRGLAGRELWQLLSWFNHNRTGSVNGGPAEWTNDELVKMLLSVMNRLGQDGFGCRLPAEEEFDVYDASDFQPEGPTSGLKSRSAADVRSEKVGWLWDGYLPLGMITLIDGEPGSGKSSLVMDLVARFSRGDRMPCSDPLSPKRAPINCAILNYEDPQSCVMVPRLKAARAITSRVELIDGDQKDGSPVQLPNCIGLLEKLVVEKQVKLIVIDPFDSMFPSGLNSNSGPDVRKVLQPLKEMCERLHISAIVIRHMNKKSGESAINRGSGSIGIVGIARAAYNVGLDPRNEEGEFVRVLSPQKFNVAPMPPSLEFTTESQRVQLDDGSVQYLGAVEWHGRCDLTANQLTGATKSVKGDGSKLQHAKSIINRALMSGPQPETEVRQLVTDAGIGESTYKTARKQLGIESKVSGFQKPHILRMPDRHVEPGVAVTLDGVVPVDDGVGAPLF
ncbi:DNA repair protein RadA [Posidoniimonas polymericola]|uniref:DNA repair protein RadA n=1 Tax=Posidoniimonas polymericola TaxID=2528002 RepID=A0A5C5XZL6_9BACT|nr:AAA family ATPase [Posidoniimonas polymericola]TWT66922.1 DNA repair protein RadA [Posidoniimonas polymericola]